VSSRRTRVPERITWAVEQLDLAPTHRVLEFGCGPGVAAALVAERVTEGSLLAIDRSATATRGPGGSLLCVTGRRPTTT
jgi:protein-L-isoaspartate O-methyltransferase